MVLSKINLLLWLELFLAWLTPSDGVHDQTTWRQQCLVPPNQEKIESLEFGNFNTTSCKLSTFEKEPFRTITDIGTTSTTSSALRNDLEASVEKSFNTEVASESSYTTPAPKESIILGDGIGVPQDLDSALSKQIVQRVAEAERYVAEEVMVNPRYESVRSNCRNKDSRCSFWSVIGECEKNPGYMEMNCAPVCKTCDVSATDRE